MVVMTNIYPSFSSEWPRKIFLQTWGWGDDGADLNLASHYSADKDAKLGTPFSGLSLLCDEEVDGFLTKLLRGKLLYLLATRTYSATTIFYLCNSVLFMLVKYFMTHIYWSCYDSYGNLGKLQQHPNMFQKKLNFISLFSFAV